MDEIADARKRVDERLVAARDELSEWKNDAKNLLRDAAIRAGRRAKYELRRMEEDLDGSGRR